MHTILVYKVILTFSYLKYESLKLLFANKIMKKIDGSILLNYIDGKKLFCYFIVNIEIDFNILEAIFKKYNIFLFKHNILPHKQYEDLLVKIRYLDFTKVTCYYWISNNFILSTYILRLSNNINNLKSLLYYQIISQCTYNALSVRMRQIDNLNETMSNIEYKKDNNNMLQYIKSIIMCCACASILTLLLLYVQRFFKTVQCYFFK